MYGMVQLDDTVEISVERVGKVRHGGMTLEVTCRIDGQLVPRHQTGPARRAPPSSTPGQGIQKQGMVLTSVLSPPPPATCGARRQAHPLQARLRSWASCAIT